MKSTTETSDINLELLEPWSSYVGPEDSAGFVFTIQEEIKTPTASETPDVDIQLKVIHIPLSVWIHLGLSVPATIFLFCLAFYAWLDPKIWHPLFWLTGAFGTMGVAVSTMVRLVTHYVRPRKK